jgi:REP element-mobilizing transposase RayT
MDRTWLLSSTTYGNWLPGDRRGFVSNVRDGEGPEVRHNLPGEAIDADLPDLERTARANLQCPPIRLTAEQARAVLNQFRETAAYRGWLLLAAAVMANHFHAVVGVAGDPDPSDLLRDLKSYASRALNKRWQKPASGTWWTESGSKRKVRDVVGAVEYVRDQPFALAVYVAESSEHGERGALAP